MLEVLKTENFCENVVHGFFAKHGGKSDGLYSSLNCSYVVGDSEENVRENLEIVRNFMGAEVLCTLKQVHGDVVHEVKKDENLANMARQIVEGDAMITREPGICLGILTADCAPVLLHEKNSNTIAAIHCGWKSAKKDIIDRVVDKINAECPNFYAAIGPCAHVESYVVQEDFVKEFAGEERFFVYENGQIKFDIVEYVKAKLVKNGINNIQIINQNTVEKTNDFFSYRQAGKLSNGICGRQISCISMK